MARGRGSALLRWATPSRSEHPSHDRRSKPPVGQHNSQCVARRVTLCDKGIRFLNRHVQQRFSACFENEFPKTSSRPAGVVARRNAEFSAFPLATPGSPLLVEVMALGAPAVGVEAARAVARTAGESLHRVWFNCRPPIDLPAADLGVLPTVGTPSPARRLKHWLACACIRIPDCAVLRRTEIAASQVYCPPHQRQEEEPTCPRPMTTGPSQRR